MVKLNFYNNFLFDFFSKKTAANLHDFLKPPTWFFEKMQGELSK